MEIIGFGLALLFLIVFPIWRATYGIAQTERRKREDELQCEIERLQWVISEITNRADDEDSQLYADILSIACSDKPKGKRQGE